MAELATRKRAHRCDRTRDLPFDRLLEMARDRFWEKVDRLGPDECWPWLAHGNRQGYGRFKIGGKGLLSTHVALALDGRPRPDQTMVAMHSCDNPRCNNPAHLSWGTSAENNADRDAKGRTVRRIGDNHPLATLTAADVTYIRLSSGKSDRQLAEELGKSASAVSQARLGQCWRHLPAPPKYNGVAKGERCATAKLSEADVIRIRESREDAAKLALELGVSPSAVTRARNGTDWGHVTDAEPVRDGQVRGERVRQAKLNERLVRELRASSLSHKELAKRYGIHASVICRVRNRRAWAHVT